MLIPAACVVGAACALGAGDAAPLEAALWAWGTRAGDAAYSAAIDFNADGVIDTADLGHWTARGGVTFEPGTSAEADSSLASEPRGLGAEWVEVDNHRNTVTGEVTGLYDGSYDGTLYRTFDLYVILPTEVSGEANVVYAQDFGIAGPNTGLILQGGTFFNHPFGEDVVPNPALFPFFPAVEFDTRGAMGPLERGQYGTPTGPVDWDPAGVFGVWSVNVPVPGGVPVPPDGRHWFARITVPATATALSGQCFVSDDGGCGKCKICASCLPGEGVIDLPNALDLPPLCPGDVNRDRVVDTRDLGRLIQAFGTQRGDDEYRVFADTNADGVIDTVDLGDLIENFGGSCD